MHRPEMAGCAALELLQHIDDDAWDRYGAKTGAAAFQGAEGQGLTLGIELADIEGQRLGHAASGIGQQIEQGTAAERVAIGDREEPGELGGAEIFPPAGGIMDLPVFSVVKLHPGTPQHVQQNQQ